MGWFIDFVWADGEWTTSEVHEQLPVGGPGNYRLHVSIYDSVYATISFRSSSRRGTGRFYLGIEPADYFDDPDASAPVDHKNEAKAFTRWVRAATGQKVDTSAVLALMAKPGASKHDEVESDVQAILALAGLPLPRKGPWGEAPRSSYGA